MFFHQNYCFSLPWQRPQRKKYLQQRQTLKEKNKIFAFSITTKLPFVMKQNGQYYSMNTVIKEKFSMPNFLSQNNHSIEIVSVFQNLMLHSVLEHVAIFPYCLTSLSYFINFHFQRFGKIEPKQKKIKQTIRNCIFVLHRNYR